MIKGGKMFAKSTISIFVGMQINKTFSIVTREPLIERKRPDLYFNSGSDRFLVDPLERQNNDNPNRTPPRSTLRP